MTTQQYQENWRFVGYFVPEDIKNTTTRMYEDSNGSSYHISRIFVDGTSRNDVACIPFPYHTWVEKRPGENYRIRDISDCRMIKYHVPEKFADPLYQGTDVGWQRVEDLATVKETIKEQIISPIHTIVIH